MPYHDVALVIIVVMGFIAAFYCGMNINSD